MVGVAIMGGYVVKHPKDLLCEGYVVGFNSVGAVNKQLFHAVSVAEVGEGLGGSREACCRPRPRPRDLVFVHYVRVLEEGCDLVVQGRK